VGHLLSTPIPGLRIDYVSPENGIGSGILSAMGSRVTWRSPGESTGDPVTIANGETRVVMAGAGSLGAYVRVTRTSADDLGGSMVVETVDVFNGAWDNVSNAERAAGDTEYRCHALKVGPYATIRNLKIWLGLLGSTDAVDASGYAAAGAVTIAGKAGFSDWPESGYLENDDTGEVMYYSSRTDAALTVEVGHRDIWTDVAGGAAGTEDDVIKSIPGLRLGIEAPRTHSDGNFTTAADEDTDPGGITFKHPTSVTDADVLEPGVLLAGNIYGLWMERHAPGGAAATARARTLIQWSYTTAA
jgi:hypothetical protein